MFFKKKKETQVIPVMTKEVYDAHREKAKDQLPHPFEDTFFAIEDSVELCTKAIECNPVSGYRWIVFLYYDDEYLTWIKENNKEVGIESETGYGEYIMRKSNWREECKRLWKKNRAGKYSLRFIELDISPKNKEDTGAFHARKPDLSGLQEELKKRSDRFWISEVPVSVNDAINCRSQIKEVAIQNIHGNKLHLGMLEREEFDIIGESAMLPFMEEGEKNSCIIKMKKTFKGDVALYCLSQKISENVLSKLANSMSTSRFDVSITQPYPIPAFVFDYIDVDEIDEDAKIRYRDYEE